MALLETSHQLNSSIITEKMSHSGCSTILLRYCEVNELMVNGAQSEYTLKVHESELRLQVLTARINIVSH